MASAVGKLQFVADVAPGMRRLLLPLYEALGDLVVVPEAGDEWGNGVMVGLSREAVEALVGAAKQFSLLRAISGGCGTHTPT